MTADPTRFGRYLVLEPLGAGAMGSVYLARDELLGRNVAVKTVRSLAGLSGLSATLFRERFMNEARAIASLSHPNVVRVFDLGIEDDTPFLVMEVVAGRSLRARLDAQTVLAPDEVRTLGVQIARALEAAHAAGILHRDLKPANLLEAEPGVWKLADFGVAHVPDSSLTLMGQFLGTPAYAAPEALEGGVFSPATDVFSVAATMYEALSGQTVYGGVRGQISVVVLAAKQAPPPLPSLRPDLPPGLVATIDRALARDPAARPTAGQFADALVHADSASMPVLAPATMPPPRRTGLWIGVGGAAALLLAIGVAIGASGGDGGGGSSPRRPPAFAPSYSTPAVAPDVRRQEKRWRKVDKSIRKGDHREATKELERIIEADPNDHQARALLEELRQGRGSDDRD